MKSSLRLVNLGFLPRGASAALLFLRVSLGGTMVALHGWEKFIRFPSLAADFPDPLGLGRHITLVTAVAVELFCALLLMAGVLTRLNAAVLLLFLLTIFWKVHGGDFSQPGAELAVVYSFGFGALVLAGGGRFSADEARGPWSLAGLGAAAGLVAGYPLSYFFQSAAYRAVTPLGEYLVGVGTVLRSEVTGNTALFTWASLTLLLALGGFVIGRWMTRRTVAVIAPTTVTDDAAPHSHDL